MMKLKEKLIERAPTRSACLRGLFCWAPLVLIALCIVALLAVGLALLLPYAYVDHFRAHLTQCTARSVEYRDSVVCNCWEATYVSCRTRYPCVEVFVDYVDTETGELVKEATLYSQPYDYSTLKMDGCSVFACTRYPDVNNQTTLDFIQQYGTPNQTFPCYHGDRADPEVLLSVIEPWTLLLGMLLPVALIVFSLVVLFFYCVVRPWFKRKLPVAKFDYAL